MQIQMFFRLLKKSATRFQEKERRILCCWFPTLIVSPPNSCRTTKGLILFRQKSDSRNMKLSGADSILQIQIHKYIKNLVSQNMISSGAIWY